MTRRDRQGCSYDAYLSDPLAGWNLTLPGDLAADIADAETAIRDLNEAGTSHVSLEGLAPFLLRAEAVASSKFEGLDAGPCRLVEAEAAIAQVTRPPIASPSRSWETSRRWSPPSSWRSKQSGSRWPICWRSTES